MVPAHPDELFVRVKRILRSALAPFVFQRVKDRFGDNWWLYGVEQAPLPSADKARALAFKGTKEEWFLSRDALFFLKYMLNAPVWKELFRTDFGGTNARAYAEELRRDRNLVEHEPVLNPVTPEKIRRVIDTARLLLDAFGLKTDAAEITALIKDTITSETLTGSIQTVPNVAAEGVQQTPAVNDVKLEPPDEIFLDTSVLRQLPLRGTNPEIAMLAGAVQKLNSCRESLEEWPVGLWVPIVCVVELAREREILLASNVAKATEALRVIAQYEEHDLSVRWLQELGDPGKDPVAQFEAIESRLDRVLTEHKIETYERDDTVNELDDVEELVRSSAFRRHALRGVSTDRLLRAARVLVNIVVGDLRERSAWLVTSDELFYDSAVSGLRLRDYSEEPPVNLRIFKTIGSVIECLSELNKAYEEDQSAE